MKNAPLRHAVEYALLLPFYGALRALPPAAGRRLGRALGGLAHALDRRHRRVASDNLSQALPEIFAGERRRVVRACFHEIGAAFGDTIASGGLDRVGLCGRLHLGRLEHLLAAEAAGRGVILITAHYGCWEVIPHAIAQASGPVVSVGRPVDNPHVDRLVRSLRSRFGNRMLDKRGAVREMFRVLRDGGRLGLLIDQRVRAAEAIDVPFFGRPALTSPIVARLALRTGAAVVPVFGELAPRGEYRVAFEPAVPTADVGEGEEAEHEITRRVMAVCERVIRAAPERWLWMHKRWKH